MKRLNEGKSIRKALPNGFLGNKRMLGANGAGQQSKGDLQQALNSFSMSLTDYAEKYGTDAAVRLIDRIGRLVDGVVADTTNDGEGTADNAAENEGTTEATEASTPAETTVSEITDKPTESYTPEETTEETTERNTTETSEVSTEPDTETDGETTDTPDVPETADLLRALLRNLRLNRKK